MVASPQEIVTLQAALATINGWGLGNLKSGEPILASPPPYPPQSGLFPITLGTELER
jgi:hypothetical protein